MTDIDLFAGPGGWDEGISELGIRPLGIEWDGAACATARAAGHLRMQADVAALDPADFAPVEGLIASPPCQGFSMAGSGNGRNDSALLLAAIPHMTGRDVRAGLHEHMTDDRSVLVLEPLRWALALCPQWCAWEQVPAVLPIWEACAAVLRGEGYSVQTGILNAEQYGVPQTRRRAILVARRNGEVSLPTPTHSRYYSTSPTRLDPGVKPWVPMVEAVGWGYTHRPSGTLVSLSGGGRRLLDGGSGAWQGVLRAVAAGQWVRRFDRLHLPLNRGEVSTCSSRDGAILQSFPAGYPWQGPPTLQSKQIGDAVPPLLARHVVAAALDVTTSSIPSGMEDVA